MGRYIEAARNQKESTSYVIANNWHTKLMEIYKQMKEEKKLHLLQNLLNSSHVGVRSWAATHYLSIDETVAKSVLQEITKQGGKLGLSAEMVIKEWDNGNLKSYYESI